MPNPAHHYQHSQQQQQQQQQHYPPQHPTAGYPATECHLMTPSSGRSIETEMPSLAFSDNSNNSTLSKVMMPQGGRPVGVPPSPSPSVSPQAADNPEGVDADYFLTSVLNMIAPVGAAPPVAHYDYLAEFTQRQRIAKGGNGEIRRAYWNSRQSIVILKSLIDTKHTPAKIAQLFDKEVEVMNQCGHHDNLVQFYGVAIRNCGDERNGDRFMIMQYYEHGDLVKLLEAPVLAPEAPSLTDRLYLAMDIATGLEHLYNCGFHHGDLHPKNILIDLRRNRSAHEGRYQARLTDFGLRRIRDNKNAFSSQQFGGVWQFMAPERMAKNRPRYDVRCDIFALGVIYWFIMAGRYPFKDFSTFRPGAREPMVEGTPHWYHTVYTQAWNEDPNARQQTLGDIIQVFRHQLGISPPAPPPSQYLDPNYPRPPYLAASYGYDHGSYPSPQYDARLFSDSSSTNGGSTARGSPMLTPAPMLTPTSLNRSGSPHPPSPLLSNAPGAPSTATARHPNHPRYRKPVIPNGLPVTNRA
ncbi:MAG: kinase-like domain-containing protein [Linnemannia gamsii]|nr:MAG: kinase-like domain-containing protein [Linnemannia gamsii]